MNKKLLSVVDFHPYPSGRFPSDGKGCGWNYREQVLIPALKRYDKVHVVLDGYNRYGRSFLDEAFSGIIREGIFSAEELKDKLTYSHSLLPDVEKFIENGIRNYNKEVYIEKKKELP